MYPQILKDIPNSPEQLYLEGNLELLSTNGIAVIGSRACSVEGMYEAKEFARNLAKQGITIISGMAVRD